MADVYIIGAGAPVANNPNAVVGGQTNPSISPPAPPPTPPPASAPVTSDDTTKWEAFTVKPEDVGSLEVILEGTETPVHTGDEDVTTEG
jgi:hypothetical protein